MFNLVPGARRVLRNNIKFSLLDQLGEPSLYVIEYLGGFLGLLFADFIARLITDDSSIRSSPSIDYQVNRPNPIARGREAMVLYHALRSSMLGFVKRIGSDGQDRHPACPLSVRC